MQSLIDSQISTEQQVKGQKIDHNKQIQITVKKAVEVAGNQGRYQVFLLIYLYLSSILAVLMWNSPAYLFMNPNFICNGQKLAQKQACQQLDTCYLDNNYTITAYAQLYCDKANERNAIQSIMGVGGLVAALVANFLSDYKGRKFSLLLTVSLAVISIILTVTGAYTKNVPTLLAGQFLTGYGAFGQIYVQSVLLDRAMSKKWYNASVFILNGAFGFGQISIFLFTLGATWKHYTIGAQATLSVFILVSGKDPVLLFAKGKYSECEEIISMIAKFNGNQHHLPDALDVLRKSYPNPSSQHTEPKGQTLKEKLSYLKIFLNWKTVTLPVLLMGSFNFSTNLSYFSQDQAASEVGISYGVDMALFGVATMLGSLPLLCFSSTVPRKKGLLFIVGLQVLLGMVMIIRVPTVLQTACISLISLLVVPRYSLFQIYLVQRFSPEIQSTTTGIIECIGHISVVLAPIMVRIADDIRVSPIVASSVCLIVFGMMPVLLLKETLQSTTKEVEESLIEPQGE